MIFIDIKIDFQEMTIEIGWWQKWWINFEIYPENFQRIIKL